MTSTTLEAFESANHAVNRAAILDYLSTAPNGATDEEMQLCIPIPANSQRPARVKLRNLGYVIDCGERRATESGRRAIVWRLAYVNAVTTRPYEANCSPIVVTSPHAQACDVGPQFSPPGTVTAIA